MPLALSERQLRAVMEAASLLPPSQRDTLLRSIAGRLAGKAHPSDDELRRVIFFVLSCYGVSMPRAS